MNKRKGNSKGNAVYNNIKNKIPRNQSKERNARHNPLFRTIKGNLNKYHAPGWKSQ